MNFVKINLWTWKDGTQSIWEHLDAKLKNHARLNSAITRVERRGGKVYVTVNGEAEEYDKIIVTAPLQFMEGLSLGCGDAVIGINPVDDSLESVARLLKMVDEFKHKWEIPTQISVLAHVTTQTAAADKLGAPMDLMFQSIAGSQKGNEAFGLTAKMLEDGRAMLLLNQRYVAYGLREIEDVRRDVPEGGNSSCQPCGASVTADEVEAIVKQVLAKLQAF